MKNSDLALCTVWRIVTKRYALLLYNFMRNRKLYHLARPKKLRKKEVGEASNATISIFFSYRYSHF